MPDIPVGYIGTPVDVNMKCNIHPQGCGRHINLGDLAFIDGSEVTFHRGQVLIAVRRLSSEGYRSCKIGLVNVLCDQLHLVGNRIGIIVKIQHSYESGSNEYVAQH